YNHAVDYVVDTSSDNLSGIDSCDGAATYSGPDAAPATVTRSCADEAGNTGTGTKMFQYDATGPNVTITLSRVPDHNGWYNHTLTISTAGSDLTSLVASCSDGQVYAGPDSGMIVTSGICTDNAGNTGTGSFTFKFDGTAPSVTLSPGRAADHNGWY